MTARRFLIAAAFLAAPLMGIVQPAIAAPGIGHTFFMRGSVVDVSGKNLVVCIGRADGAEAGQVLKVYRNVSRPGPRSGASFTRTEIGTVRIDSTLNDHFATASPLTGGVKLHDIVELERPVR